MALVYKVSTDEKFLGDTIIGRQAMQFAVVYAKRHNIPVKVTAQIMNTEDCRTVAVMPNGQIVKLWS